MPQRNQHGAIKWNCHPVPDDLHIYSDRYGSKEFYLPLPLQIYDYFRKQAGMTALAKSVYEYDGQIWGFEDKPAKEFNLWS